MKITAKTFFGIVMALFLFAAAPARAEDKPGAAGNNEGWEPVAGGMMQQPGEGYQATNLVAGAYAFIWVMVAGFVLMVWRRTDGIERELAELQKRIGDAAKKAS